MNNAIKLAIEKGGYKNKRIDLGSDGNLYTFGERFHDNELENTLALDPLFWQCLGKALGWKEGLTCKTCDGDNGKDWNNQLDCGCPQRKPIEKWKDTAHQYFDIRLTNGDVEAFWSNLLKNA